MLWNILLGGLPSAVIRTARPRATRQASWFMCKKQDNPGCYYTHMETHTLPEWDVEAYSSATSERVQYMHLLHTRAHAHKNSISNKAWELLLCEK